MKTVIAIIILTLGAAVFIHIKSPEWLAQYLPGTDKTAPHFEKVPDIDRESAWIAGYGQIEPASQERHIAFDINGLISKVHVEEGDLIRKDDLLASLRDDEYTARLEAARADTNAEKANYDKLIAGARKEEKIEALSVVKRSKSVMENARREMNRRKELLAKQLIAKEEVDRAVKDYLVAEKEYEEAVQRHLITKNLSRKEDIAIAWAKYEAATKRVSEMQSLLDKAHLRSPIDGRVLRVHRRAGENVSVFFECPVLTVADLSSYQIRAEINEKYAALIEQGQKAYFTSDTYGSHRFEGRVARVSLITGRKTIALDRPQEKNDTKILEVIIKLDQPDDLITGLTGDVFILTSDDSNTVMGTVSNQTPNRKTE